MLVNLKYDQVEGSALKGEVNGKAVNLFMQVEVDNSNVEQALERFKGNKWVVGLDYVGDVQQLVGLNLNGLNVLVKKDYDGVEQIDEALKGIPEGVNLVMKLPLDYSDMRVIHTYSQKYPNLRFCGGTLLRINGCHIGCIEQQDVFKKIPDSKLSLVCEGCSCVYKHSLLDDFDLVEFYNDANAKVKTAKISANTGTKQPKKPSNKNQLSSLLTLAKSKGVDNF